MSSCTTARVATVAFKYPRDGAGRLYCYFHILGEIMVRGYAAGGGYDKHSAAFEDAARKLAATLAKQPEPDRDWRREDAALAKANLAKLIDYARANDGHSWHEWLRSALGWTTIQAV